MLAHYFKTLQSVFCSYQDGVPKKFQKTTWNQFTVYFIIMDCVSLVSTPLRIRWTIPFSTDFVYITHYQWWASYFHKVTELLYFRYW
jgi:hypothetical protein